MRGGAWAMLGLGVTLCATAAAKDVEAPWGHADAADRGYRPPPIVYDGQADSNEEFARLLDHVSYLKKVNGAPPFDTSVVAVLHSDGIDLFAIDEYLKHQPLMKRARSLAMDGIVEFQVCEVAGDKRGHDPRDLHGFVETVPMADAEIIRLQRRQDYAYMEF